MSTLSVKNPTLLDVAKATNPDGSIATVAEILSETNEILTDMVFAEGNLPTGHKSTIRTGLPQPTWRKMYGGVQPSKGRTAQITDNCGMLEDYAEVDKALADLNGNTNAFRLIEDRAHIEGMSQEMGSTLFFGDEDLNPERFTGLAPRYSLLSAGNGENILDAGGTGSDNRSIWLVVWGESTVHGIYPKGSQAGLKMDNKGQVTIENVDGNGGRMEAYRTHYRWDLGLVVRDWRYVVRIANIDKSNLSTVYTAGAFASGADLSNLMFQAARRVPSLKMGKPVFYMDRDTETTLFQQTSAKTSGSTLRTENVGGEIITYFQSIPIRRCDVLSADEARVV